MACRIGSSARLLLIGWVLTAATGWGQAQDSFTLYPREYASTVDNDKVVGDGGHLKVVEDADGEQIEVVEYAVPRSKQRDGDIVLFSTQTAKNQSTNALTRTYMAWVNGTIKELTFTESDAADRTLYRRGSADYDRKISRLFDTARLNATVGKLVWFARNVDTNPAARMAPVAARASDYASLRRQLVQRDQDILHLQALQYNLDRVAALRKDFEAARKEQTALSARLPEMSNDLAKVEQELSGKTVPRGDATARRKAILQVEEYELRADIRYQEKRAAGIEWTVSAIGSNAAVTVSNELVAAGVKDLAAYAAAAPEQLAQTRALVEKKLQGLLSDRKAIPDIPAILTAAARETPALMKALAARKDLDDKGKALLKTYAEAYANQGPEAEMAEALATWTQAVAAIHAVDFGRYRITMVSRLQGIPRCIGTPIIVEAGGVKKPFYSYQWPDSEDYHPQTFDVDFGEAPGHVLYFDPPYQSGRYICQSLDEYNDVRLKGWKLEDETTFSRLAKEMFAGPKNDPATVIAGYVAQQYGTRGTFEINLTLCRTRRHQGSDRFGVGAAFQTGGMGAPDASLDVLYLDSFKIEKVPEPGLVLRQVLVQKNWIKPGQDTRFMGWMHNRTDAEQTGKLKTILAWGLNDTQVIDEREVKLAPKSYARVVVPWQSATNAPWYGQEVRMELTCNGQTTRAADTFSIHPNTFPVLIPGGALGYDVYRGPKEFINQRELFGITPADSVGILPDDIIAPYTCGMSSRLVAQIVASRASAQGHHQLGIAFTHYLAPLCTGVMTYPQYLKNPEWFPGRLAWTEQANDNWNTANRLIREQYYTCTGVVDQVNIFSNYPNLHLEQPVNHGQKALFDAMVEELITYSYLVPWDGTRWDGGPLSVYPKDFLGRSLKHYKTGQAVTNDAECKQLGAELLHELKERMWKHHPEWVYANNGDNDGYGGTLTTLEKDPPDVKDYPQYIEFMKDNGGFMDEGWMSAYIFSDARNKLENYLKICFKESMVMKRYGGNLWTFSPERDGNPYFNVDYMYYTALPYLCGSTYVGSLSRTPWSEDGPVYFFTRFSEFLLDRSWRPYPQAAERITVDAPNVWATEVATWRQIDKNHVQLVLPIINRHPRQRLMETQNRYSEVPEPIAGSIGVTVKAPDGFQDVTPEVWELTCEPRTAATTLKATPSKGAVSFGVPGLKMFKVIVMDFRRKS